MAKLDKKQVCELLDHGIYNMAEIGRKVGCTRENVRQLLADTGKYKGGGKISRNKDIIIGLLVQGVSVAEVARRHGYSWGGVQAAIKKWKNSGELIDVKKYKAGRKKGTNHS